MDAHARFVDSGDTGQIRRFERENLPALPRAERDYVLRSLAEQLRLDPSFVQATKGLDERAVLLMIEDSLLSEED